MSTPMAGSPLAPLGCAVLALVALAGCTSKPSADQGNGAATATAASQALPLGGSHPITDYPAWAAAVPPYASNVTSASPSTDEIYQIHTADSYETVLAWYKAHVKTTWPDRHPDQTAAKIGNVHITLQKSAPPTASDPTQTIIGIIKQGA
jgi:hypothetical protein